ncbi:MAG: general secretion pathway protein GspK [Acidobacteriota bacterium]|nr:MAG: general secretion pathway protein GspK [Acidobacteriota bacterium]
MKSGKEETELDLPVATASLTNMREERGAILIVVLWIVLAVSMLALSFSASIRTEVDAARNVIVQKQSYYMARAGIEYAVYKIFESQSAFAQSQQLQNLELDAVPEALTGRVTLNLGSGAADVELIDESGKINLNFAPEHLLFNLMIMIGIPGEVADEITESIADWRDPDEFPHDFGAESEFYSSLPQPYRIKNSFFDLPEELLLVRGVTPQIYYGRKSLTENGDRIELYGLQNYFTTFSNVNRINANSAPVPVLAAIPGLDYSTALMIEDLRSQTPLRDISQISERIPGISGEMMGFLAVLRSNVYTINSLGRVGGSNVVSRIRAVIRVDGTGPKGYAVLYWNEANVEL